MIAAITTCTNTSNPQVMVGAGLLAKKAVERGLQRKPWVKSSLAPGSKVVTEYYEQAGLTTYLEQLGFHTVGYGCTTCIGNSGPLAGGDLGRGRRGRPRRLRRALRQPQLRGAHPPGGEGELPRVAAARRRVRARRPDGHRPRDRAARPGRATARTSSSATSGRRRGDRRRRSTASVRGEMFRRRYADVFAGDERWRELPVPEGELFAWEPDSTYVRQPPYFDGMPPEPRAVRATSPARAASSCSATPSRPTTSRPRASIKPDSPAGQYLIEHGVERKDFNSYGSRRGNHEVMVRGTFANVRLRNLLVPGSEGTWTVHLPAGEEMTIYDASRALPRRGTPLIVIAGKEYGSGSSRDWAAKGPNLLGVRAVIAESYERIHRSNLLMMGVLPLQFRDGETPASLGLTGREDVRDRAASTTARRAR